MSEKVGLRERKKQKTRLAISKVATRLFIERGFDRVTVAEVAEAAEVSVNTIFNYFATKEDLFFDRADELEVFAAQVVRERKPGESALAALRRRFFDGLVPHPDAIVARRLAQFFGAIEASPALQARLRLSFDRSEDQLAEVLAEETGAKTGDVTPRVVAGLVISLYRNLFREMRTRLLDGSKAPAVRTALHRIGERGLSLLEPAIGDYCVRPKG